MIRNKKVEIWAERELSKYMQHLIIPEHNRTISVFGRFVVVPKQTGVRVYENRDLRAVLTDIRTAISWCVAQKYKRIDLAQRIEQLDQTLRTTIHDIQQRKRLAHRSRRLDFKNTVMTKLQTKIQYQSAVSQQLEKCIGLTKYLQRKGFQNETARTRCA